MQNELQQLSIRVIKWVKGVTAAHSAKPNDHEENHVFNLQMQNMPL